MSDLEQRTRVLLLRSRVVKFNTCHGAHDGMFCSSKHATRAAASAKRASAKASEATEKAKASGSLADHKAAAKAHAVASKKNHAAAVAHAGTDAGSKFAAKSQAHVNNNARHVRGAIRASNRELNS